MKVRSLNVSMPVEVEYRGKLVSTGIFKKPVSGQITLRSLNFEGDGQADLIAHGGVYKAVYAYPFEHYAPWQAELNRDDLEYGQFGENLTVDEMNEDSVHIGDVFRVGSALLQVTQPRVPCFKLAMKMGLPDFVKTFHKSERTGFYLRVLEEGAVSAGDSIERVETDPVGMTVREVNYALYGAQRTVEMAQRAIKIEGLAPGWRDSFAEIILNAQS